LTFILNLSQIVTFLPDSITILSLSIIHTLMAIYQPLWRMKFMFHNSCDYLYKLCHIKVKAKIDKEKAAVCSQRDADDLLKNVLSAIDKYIFIMVLNILITSFSVCVIFCILFRAWKKSLIHDWKLQTYNVL
jgi:hypothetical protein